MRALDAVSLGAKPKIAPDEPISLLDYRLIEAAGGTIDNAAILKQAAPSLLAALALDPGTQPDLKLAAAEGGGASERHHARAARANLSRTRGGPARGRLELA